MVPLLDTSSEEGLKVSRQGRGSKYKEPEAGALIHQVPLVAAWVDLHYALFTRLSKTKPA